MFLALSEQRYGAPATNAQVGELTAYVVNGLLPPIKDRSAREQRNPTY
jgi:hypothetical protein